MDNSFQTSFIPKKPIVSEVGHKTRQSVSLFSLIAIIIIIIVILSSVGLFLYKSYLTKEKDLLSSSLSKISDSFDVETIKELKLYDSRMTSSKQILSSHIALSPLFKRIEELTIPQIQYTKFEHKTDTAGFSVNMSGVARDYSSIALQADVFNNDKKNHFKNIIFSNLTRTTTSNRVNFDVEFTVDPALLSYETSILSDSSSGNVTQNIPTDSLSTGLNNNLQ
jgi:hypothetical protein